ncbi:hypothetical protein DH2020_011379 [Rehmannia glutinosa]|uniref:Uncharacterized protein n=1 Tax=Rehmannia glutinosa TaxID=99300 RepID=A0ABR0XDC1_REHGL
MGGGAMRTAAKVAGITVANADSMPRVVFGGSPTLQEAREATAELAVVLEKAYLSSTGSVGRDGSLAGDDNSSLSISGLPVMDCVTSDIGIAPEVPAHVIKAFRLLHDSSVAQNIVASIACDPNVWNAVLHNQELQEFMQSQRTCFACSDLNQSSADSNDVASEYSESQPDSGFVDIIEKVKVTVVDMMSNLSDYFRSFFGGEGVNRVISSSDGSANAETVMEASFVGLAVMAIMVILVKRV